MEKAVQDSLRDFGPILGRIVESKRREVEALRQRVPLEEMRARAADAAPARDFRGAVAHPGRVGLIAEVKKASPSKGLIRADFDPEAIARAYRDGGASALSVLTDGPFFQGSAEIFARVRAAVDLPLLRKEFMIDPIQFYEARAMGADAVLLITSILPPPRLEAFHDLATQLGMAVLVETHSEADLRRAMGELRPCLLGVNNRDLHSEGFRTDIAHTEKMLPLIRSLAGAGGPPPVVSESGIRSPGDVARLKAMGISAILVGESLMRQEDVRMAVRELMAQAG